MFHERTITNLHEKYLQEQVDCELGDIEELTTPAPLIALIDKQVNTIFKANKPKVQDRV
jgi:hypothetical protein